VSSDRRK